jgi:hypothetical protein
VCWQGEITKAHNLRRRAHTPTQENQPQQPTSTKNAAAAAAPHVYPPGLEQVVDDDDRAVAVVTLHQLVPVRFFLGFLGCEVLGFQGVRFLGF